MSFSPFPYFLQNWKKRFLFQKVFDRLQNSSFYTFFLCNTKKLKKEVQSYYIKRPKLLDDLCIQLKIRCFLTFKSSEMWFLQLQRSKSILQTKNIGKVEILKISPHEALWRGYGIQSTALWSVKKIIQNFDDISLHKREYLMFSTVKHHSSQCLTKGNFQIFHFLNIFGLEDTFIPL